MTPIFLYARAYNITVVNDTPTDKFAGEKRKKITIYKYREDCSIFINKLFP